MIDGWGVTVFKQDAVDVTTHHQADIVFAAVLGEVDAHKLGTVSVFGDAVVHIA